MLTIIQSSGIDNILPACSSNFLVCSIALAQLALALTFHSRGCGFLLPLFELGVTKKRLAPSLKRNNGIIFGHIKRRGKKTEK